jgi:hypothetical protein
MALPFLIIRSTFTLLAQSTKKKHQEHRILHSFDCERHRRGVHYVSSTQYIAGSLH